VELAWELEISPYNHANLNSHSGRSRQIRILGEFTRIFPNQIEPQQIRRKFKAYFASRIFNSNPVSNLSLLPKG
jgi:hypothetical protein